MRQGAVFRLLVATSALCFLVSFVAASVDEVVPETEMAEENAKHAEQSFALSETAGARVAVKSKNEQVLRNIIMLRAYAIAAHDAAVAMKFEHSQMGKSVIGDLILRLGGAKVTVKEKDYLVSRYAKAVGLCLSRFKMGVGKYIIRRITKAIRQGNGVIKIYHDRGLIMVGLDHKAMGFVSRPMYIRQLGVRIDQYVRARHLVTKFAKGADHAAAIACFLKGKIKQYRSFYQRIKDKYRYHAKNYWHKMVRGAEEGERKSFHKHHHIGKQVTAGKVSAQQVLNRIMKLQQSQKAPSKAQMKAEAKQMAAKWLKENKDSCDMQPYIHESDKKARGCVALRTPNKYAYKNTKPPTKVAGDFTLQVSVKAKTDAHIALSRTPKFQKGKNEMYEIVIGGWGNSKICIRDKQQGPCLAAKVFKNEGPLSKNEHRRFYIRRKGSVLSIDRKVKGKYHSLVRWGGYGKIKAQFVSVSTGFGALGRWLICSKAKKIQGKQETSKARKTANLKKFNKLKVAKKTANKKAITVKKEAVAQAVQTSTAAAVSPIEEEHEQEKREAEDAAAEAQKLDDEAKQEMKEEAS